MRSVSPRILEPSAVHLALGQPARRLVEQQELRLRHEGAGQRGALLNGVGQGGGEPAGIVGGAELVEDLHGAGGHPPLLPARAPQPEEGRRQVAVQPRLGPEHDVLVHRQSGAQADALQRAGDPELGQVVGVMRAQDLAAVGDRARTRMDETADHVEQGRLPGAVRPDDADDLARGDRHRHLVERQEPAESRRLPDRRREGHHPRARPAVTPAPSTPRGLGPPGDLPGAGGGADPLWARPTSSHAYQPPGIAGDVTAFDTRASGTRKRVTGVGAVGGGDPPSSPR